MISQVPRHRGFLTGEVKVIYKHTDADKFCIMKEINSLRKGFWSPFNFTPGLLTPGPVMADAPLRGDNENGMKNSNKNK